MALLLFGYYFHHQILLVSENLWGDAKLFNFLRGVCVCQCVCVCACVCVRADTAKVLKFHQQEISKPSQFLVS